MSLRDTLTPAHLMGASPSEESRKAAVTTATAPVPSPADDRKRRMEARRYAFQFSHQPRNGAALVGEFTSEVPDQATLTQIDAMAAQLTGFAPVSALTEMAFGRALMLAQLTYCLVVRPAWAKDLGKVVDGIVLQKLHAEVLEHQATFLG